MQANKAQINPFALLAAMIFNAGKIEKAMIQPDDQQEPIEVDVKIVGIAQEDDAALVCIPAEKVAFFQANPHDVHLRVENGHVIAMFRKQGHVSALLNVEGKKLAPQNDETMNRLMEKLA